MNALDLGLFINGLPIATFELKNSLTKQTVEDAVEQYKRDRNPRELLFQFGRCIAHFAVDDSEVRFCTQLKGKASWFLPFNKGWNDGAGNPPNPDGLKTDYLWKQVLDSRAASRTSLKITRRSSRSQTRRPERRSASKFFRDITNSMSCGGCSRTAGKHGAGKRYLIEHSAGSGKSNSIAWLAHQLVGLEATTTSRCSIRHRRDRPQHSRRPAPQDDQELSSGRRDRRPCRALRRSAAVHRGRQEDHRFDRAEVSVHSRRDRERTSRASRSPSLSTRRIRAKAERLRRR